MKKRGHRIAVFVSVGAALLVALACLPIAPEVEIMPSSGPRSTAADGEVAPPAEPVQLLFIHHSCGGQWLAERSDVVEGEGALYRAHPNGGGLRSTLEANNYVVHEATYGSVIGEDTDILDWPDAFRARIEDMLVCDHQDVSRRGGEPNQVIVFKSCFPNNAFVGEGKAPGDARGPELTVWNARAAYEALLPVFREHPQTLFVAVTAPPLAPGLRPEPLWKHVARSLTGRGRAARLEAGAPLARRFNTWLVSPEGWLADHDLPNVVAFDYYDVLTAHGESDLARYATGGGTDSHPSAEGNTRATAEFVPFLNAAVRRAKLVPAGSR